MENHIDYSKEVTNALTTGKPVIALESTLITHGLPAPYHLQIAKESENIARELGVVPATIAIVNGRIKIGLTEKELNILVSDPAVIKASKRDIPFAVSQQLNAGTTVAATLFCAHQAGIRLFATGGIGGVHRGDANDISADLIELANTPIAVICAGAKSILDLPRTLEYLETCSVPVIGYQTDVLPAFYTARSPYQLSTQCHSIEELAAFVQTHWALQMKTGIVIANPIPFADEIPANIIEPAIQKALFLAEDKGIMGKAVTPFILKTVRNIAGEKSLTANLSLIKNNVRLGAQLAKNVHQLIKEIN